MSVVRLVVSTRKKLSYLGKSCLFVYWGFRAGRRQRTVCAHKKLSNIPETYIKMLRTFHWTMDMLDIHKMLEEQHINLSCILFKGYFVLMNFIPGDSKHCATFCYVCDGDVNLIENQNIVMLQFFTCGMK